tara:strand:+ start:167 stop:361 length:195 start_codon:yes stop_codon:yes gene_type:complete
MHANKCIHPQNTTERIHIYIDIYKKKIHQEGREKIIMYTTTTQNTMEKDSKPPHLDIPLRILES